MLGLCGGYQMLGRAVHDPEGIEGTPGTAAGLGLLDVETTLANEKRLEKIEGTIVRRRAVHRLRDAYGADRGPRLRAPLRAARRWHAEGAMSAAGRVIGTYIHGLFADDRQRAAWLARFAPAARPSPTMRSSTTRSTRSPRISRRISTSTGCSA